MRTLIAIKQKAQLKYAFAFILIITFLTACGDDRGGVIVDSSGEQGGGTQPGGGGFAFVILFLVVASCVAAMFTMDRIKSKKNQKDSDDK